MKITIACVGKIKEKYLTAGIDEFTKRLTPFCKLETVAINEEKIDKKGKKKGKHYEKKIIRFCAFAGGSDASVSV